MILMFSPNGTLPQDFWPEQEGENFEFKPILKPLEPFKKRTLVLNGVFNKVRGDGDSPAQNSSPATSAAAVAIPRVGLAASPSTKKSKTTSKAKPPPKPASAPSSSASPSPIVPTPGPACLMQVPISPSLPPMTLTKCYQSSMGA
jgi:hypothetical protein